MTQTFYSVDSFKFADVVKHWGRERLVHEVLVAGELARGVIREGLRFQSVDPKWTKSSATLRGLPLVGYTARPDLPPVLIRGTAMEHMLAIARDMSEPDHSLLAEEFVTRDEFRKWLVRTGRELPKFWFGANERHERTL